MGCVVCLVLAICLFVFLFCFVLFYILCVCFFVLFCFCIDYQVINLILFEFVAQQFVLHVRVIDLLLMMSLYMYEIIQIVKIFSD